jgi:hypothetical protein
MDEKSNAAWHNPKLEIPRMLGAILAVLGGQIELSMEAIQEFENYNYTIEVVLSDDNSKVLISLVKKEDDPPPIELTRLVYPEIELERFEDKA